jgi:hypothetical protein
MHEGLLGGGQDAEGKTPSPAKARYIAFPRAQSPDIVLGLFRKLDYNNNNQFCF